MSEGAWMGLAALVGALAAAAVSVYSAVRKGHGESESATNRHWRELCEWYRQQVEDQDRLMAEMYAAEAEYREALAQQYGWMERCRDWMARCAEGQAAQPPELPPRPELASMARRVEFLARQTAQNKRQIESVHDHLARRGPAGG